MNEDNARQNANKWFKIANNDILFAKAGFKETEIASDACFLCQQIAEKYLKGFLVSKKIKPERIHILPTLLRKCIEIDKGFIELGLPCEFLDQFYNPVRYPDDIQIDFKKETAERAFEAAEKIVEFIKNKI